MPWAIDIKLICQRPIIDRSETAFELEPYVGRLEFSIKEWDGLVPVAGSSGGAGFLTPGAS